MVARHAVALGICAVAAACNLVFDLSSLRSDAGTDAGATDSALPDTGGDAPTAPATWCTSIDADFCADFDRADAGWQSVASSGGGSASTYLLDYVSAPASGYTAIPATMTDAAPGAVQASFGQLVPANGRRHAIVEWDGKRKGPALVAGQAAIFLYVMLNGAQGVALVETEQGFSVFPTASAQGFGLDAAVPRDQWVRVRVDVVLDIAPRGAVEVSVVTDGGAISVLSRQGITTATDPMASTVFVWLGATHGTGDVPAAQHLIDNVVVRLQ